MSTLLRNRSLWYLAAFLVIVVIITSMLEPYLLGQAPDENEWHPIFVVTRNFVFLGIICLVAWKFGFILGSVAMLVIVLMLLPHVITETLIEGYHLGVLAEYAIVIPVGVLLAWLIGTRKQIEDKLKDSEKRYRRLFETAQDAILILDGNSGKIIDANPFVKDLLGFTQEELVGKNLWEIGEIKDTLASKISYQELHESGYKRWANLPLVSRDGRQISVEVIANAYMVDHSRIIQCNIRDMTAVNLAAKALKTLNEDLKVAQRLTKIGNWKWIIATNKVTWSDELCRINGWDPEVPVPLFTEMERFYTPEGWKRLNEIVTKAFNTGEPYEIELTQIRTDGTRITTVSRGEIDFDANGKIVSLHGTVQDITGRIKLQQQIMAQDRLASIGQLVSGAAHEINNPLTGVIGFSELLLRREDLPDDAKEDLKVINGEAIRASRIVKNLLTFARRQPEGKEPVKIHQQIRGVLVLRKQEQKANKIQVITSFASDLPQVMGNASQLQQVFFNIISNAEFFMLEAHQKGNLTITTERTGDFVRISFSDDGPGISPENMSKLFTPFFTTKGVGKGTGLGLSICHGMVTEHGGRIYAESELGKGATFVVELPIKKTTTRRKVVKS